MVVTIVFLLGRQYREGTVIHRCRTSLNGCIIDFTRLTMLSLLPTKEEIRKTHTHIVSTQIVFFYVKILLCQHLPLVSLWI